MAKRKTGTIQQIKKSTQSQTKITYDSEILDVWKKYARQVWAVVITTYLFLLTILFVYAILQFWPS